jgi:AcrR family transcriptional regulator
VARRSGLSKSGLYGHFKSKGDMLHRLFMTEFMRIIDFARQGMGRSEVRHEKLYLGIFSIAVYLRSKPDILVAMDWVRTRRHDFVKAAGQATPSAQTGGAGAGGVGDTGCDNAVWEDGPPPEFPKIFEDIEINPLQSGEISGVEGKVLVSHWILFLLINILMRPGETKTLKNEDIRFLFRFITLGIKGFEK